MYQEFQITDEEILESWRDFAASQQGFVGEMLKTLRDCEGSTEDKQRESFGIDNEGFQRLKSMARPRYTALTNDSRRIAEACNLKCPLAFVQAMILASKLEQKKSGHEFYQAAFDIEVDLDCVPNGE